MDRRYQVFISSTFEDLEHARRDVSDALLKTNCFPAGMELFPAADEEQFDYICSIIRDSDYYIVISAGRYGSIHPETQKSYTEMEYDYAVEIGKPILRLLHKTPFESLPGKLVEKTDSGKEHLQQFRRKLAATRLVDYWTDPKELGQKVILGLIELQKRKPMQGWVRGENALTPEILRELEQLRTKRLVAKAKPREEVVSFDDLKGQTNVAVFVASSEEDDNGKQDGTVPIKNSLIAEAVLRALISRTSALSVGKSASDLLTETIEFPKKYTKHPHFWFELTYKNTEVFLHYLESRGLVRGREVGMGWDWQLTERGRIHATFISSRRQLS